jgi:hypothetical protein
MGTSREIDFFALKPTMRIPLAYSLALMIDPKVMSTTS